ncbi:MAG: Hsp20 family protein [Alphaproteobacteria bacterium]|nr:Hsp20 family protein [Alphaproteobacteria bacterium]
MSRLALNTPFMLGFENLERMMEELAKAGSEGFPPYNIEQLSDTQLRISLAVAGYDEQDLDVSVEDDRLIIRGRSALQEQERHFLYRGIAGRNFQKTFVLAHGMKVQGAFMDKGLLHIDLFRVEPVATVTKIKIAPPAKNKTLVIPGKAKEKK